MLDLGRAGWSEVPLVGFGRLDQLVLLHVPHLILGKGRQQQRSTNIKLLSHQVVSKYVHLEPGRDAVLLQIRNFSFLCRFS